MPKIVVKLSEASLSLSKGRFKNGRPAIIKCFPFGYCLWNALAQPRELYFEPPNTNGNFMFWRRFDISVYILVITLYGLWSYYADGLILP